MLVVSTKISIFRFFFCYDDEVHCFCSDEEMGVPTSMTIENLPLPRNSEDLKLVNDRGKDFLDLCRTNDICIANGTTVGDIFGKYTCHQARGSSVVDYLLTPFRAYPQVIELVVGEYLPSLSDHCPLTPKINVSNSILEEEIISPIELFDLPQRYIWSSDKSKTFKESTESPSFQEEVRKLMDAEENENMISDIQKTPHNYCR